MLGCPRPSVVDGGFLVLYLGFGMLASLAQIVSSEQAQKLKFI